MRSNGFYLVIIVGVMRVGPEVIELCRCGLYESGQQPNKETG